MITRAFVVPVRCLHIVIVIAGVSVVVGGCRDNTPAPAVPAVAPNPDAKILQELDYFEPVYQIDAAGRVIRLRLPWRDIPMPLLAEIGKLTELRALEISGTTITDEGLAQLLDLQKLRSLSLVHAPITDKGLEQLAKFSSLQFVWVSKHAVTEEALENLKMMRPSLNVYPL
jgi:hypothetical protein